MEKGWKSLSTSSDVTNFSLEMSPVRKMKIVKKKLTSFPRFQADKFKRMNVGSILLVVFHSSIGESLRVLMDVADVVSEVPL